MSITVDISTLNLETSFIGLNSLANHLRENKTESVKIQGKWVDRNQAIGWLREQIGLCIDEIDTDKRLGVLELFNDLGDPEEFLNDFEDVWNEVQSALMPEDIDNDSELRSEIESLTREYLSLNELSYDQEALDIKTAEKINVKESIEIASKNISKLAKFKLEHVNDIVQEIERGMASEIESDPIVKSGTRSEDKEERTLSENYEQGKRTLNKSKSVTIVDKALSIASQAALDGKPESIQLALTEIENDPEITALGDESKERIISKIKTILNSDRQSLIEYHQAQRELKPKTENIVKGFQERYNLNIKESIGLVSAIDERMADGKTSIEALTESLAELQRIDINEASLEIVDKNDINSYVRSLRVLDHRHIYGEPDLTLDNRRVDIQSVKLGNKAVKIRDIQTRLNIEAIKDGGEILSRKQVVKVLLGRDVSLGEKIKSKLGDLEIGNKVKINDVVGKFKARNLSDLGQNKNINFRIIGQRVIAKKILGNKFANKIQRLSVSKNIFKARIGRFFTTNRPTLGIVTMGRMKKWSMSGGIRGVVGRTYRRVYSLGHHRSKTERGILMKHRLRRLAAVPVVGRLLGFTRKERRREKRKRFVRRILSSLATKFILKSLWSGVGSFIGGTVTSYVGGAIASSLFGPAATIIGNVIGGGIGFVGGAITGKALDPQITKLVKGGAKNVGRFAKKAGGLGNATSKVLNTSGIKATVVATQSAAIAISGVITVGVLGYFNINQIYNAFFLPSLDQQEGYEEFINYCSGSSITEENKPEIPAALEEIFKRVSNDTNVDYDILAAILRVETGLKYFENPYDSDCDVSECGAVGPMQITKATGYVSTGTSTCDPEKGEICVNCDPGEDNTKAICSNYCKVCTAELKSGEDCEIGETFVTKNHMSQFNTWGSCSGNPCDIEDSLRCAAEVLKGKVGVSSFKIGENAEKLAQAVLMYHGEYNTWKDTGLSAIDYCATDSPTWSRLGNRSYCQFVLEWIGESASVGSEMMAGFASGFPIDSGTITQGVGGSGSHNMGTGTYNSIDFISDPRSGNPIKATHDGVVITSVGGFPANKIGSGYGNYVVIQGKTADGRIFETLYGHLLPGGLAEKNKEVSKGETIGYMDHTGYSTGPHLHYELRTTSDSSLYKILLGCTLPLPEQKMTKVNGGCVEDCGVSF